MFNKIYSVRGHKIQDLLFYLEKRIKLEMRNNNTTTVPKINISFNWDNTDVSFNKMVKKQEKEEKLNKLFAERMDTMEKTNDIKMNELLGEKDSMIKEVETVVETTKSRCEIKKRKEETQAVTKIKKTLNKLANKPELKEKKKDILKALNDVDDRIAKSKNIAVVEPVAYLNKETKQVTSEKVTDIVVEIKEPILIRVTNNIQINNGLKCSSCGSNLTAMAVMNKVILEYIKKSSEFKSFLNHNLNSWIMKEQADQIFDYSNNISRNVQVLLDSIENNFAKSLSNEVLDQLTGSFNYPNNELYDNG
jgi:hypothetical protein